MIVVNRGRRLVGQELEVVIDSVLQTSAGRMAFAELVNAVPTSVLRPTPELAPLS
jgi:hypothetical protein